MKRTGYIIICAALIVMVVICLSGFGNVQAGTKKSKTIKVETVEQLTAAMSDPDITKIKFETSMVGEITFPEMDGHWEKTIDISAPGVSVCNKSRSFDFIIRGIKKFTESGEYNSIIIKADNAEVIVPENCYLSSLSLKANMSTVRLGTGATIGWITFSGKKAYIEAGSKSLIKKIVCNKKSSAINLKLDDETGSNIVINKKTNIKVSGKPSGNVDITSNAKGSSITAAVPVKLTAKKNAKLTLKKGSESSVVVSASKDVNVKIKNSSKEDSLLRLVTDDGKSDLEEVFKSRNKDTEHIDQPWVIFKGNRINCGRTNKSYIYKEDENFYRLEVGVAFNKDTELYNFDGKMHIEKYDSLWRLIECYSVEFDPNLVWGGFYHGEKYNYVILGEITDETGNDIIKVFKYDREWKEIGGVGLKGEYKGDNEIYVPFYTGDLNTNSLKCVELNNYLYVHTAFAWVSDRAVEGIFSITFSIDTKKMEIASGGYKSVKGDPLGPLNQYILADDKNQIITADCTTYHPSIIMNIYDTKNGKLLLKKEKIPIHWDKYKNCSLFGGFEETTLGYVAAFSYDVAETGFRDLYLGFVTKSLPDNPSESTGIRIKYPSDENITTGYVKMISMGIDKGGYIIWEEYPSDVQRAWNPDMKICYAKYYPDGSVSDVYTFPGILSDCDLIYEDGGIHWYTTGKPGEWDKTVPCFYSLDVKTGKVRAQFVGEPARFYTAKKQSKEKETYIVNGDSGIHRNLFDKDIYDSNGRRIATEYYNDKRELCCKATYEYDKDGLLSLKTYVVLDIPGNEYSPCVYAYDKNGKIKSISKTLLTSKGILPDRDFYYEYYENEIEKMEITKKYCFWGDSWDTLSYTEVSEKHFDEKGRMISDVYDDGTDEQIHGYTELYTYNEDGSYIKKRTDWRYGETLSCYNPDGIITKSVSNLPEAGVLTTEYNEKGKKIKSVYDNGSEEGNGNYVTTYIYNIDNSYIEVTEFADGTKRVNTYGEKGDIIESKRIYPDGTVDIISS